MEIVGRTTELSHLAERLRSRRLVTIIGPGGIGKTTLARAGAARAAYAFEQGTYEIDLTRIDTDAEVEHALAGQLGFSSFESLLESPTEQPVLLVIDNCEHVVDAVADAVDRLLTACRAPTVLATSRAPLDLPEESLIVLGPLPVPAPGQIDSAIPSVRLFLDRATDAGTEIGDDQLAAVCELCRRLDGVPLALDIAAARTRSMSIDEILRRFGDADLSVFSRPRYRGAARHRSLRATVEWSYGLLTPENQQFFDRLGVFSGPFTMAMARAVSGEATDDTTRERVERLLDASLVAAESVGTDTWYRLVATLRSFAVERLRERIELNATMERFAEHAAAEAQRLIEQSRPSWPAMLLVRLLTLHDNLAAAARWCIDHDTEPDRAFTLVKAMWGVIHQSRAEEVEALGTRVLERWPDPGRPGWADTAATVATARFILGRLDASATLVDQAFATADRSPFAPVTLCRVLGQIRQARGETATALEAFDDAERIARDRSLNALAMESAVFAAVLLGDLGRIDEALERLRRIREEAEGAGSDISWIWAATAAAYVRLRVDPATALPEIRMCLDLARSAEYPAGVTSNLRSLAIGLMLINDRAKATDVAHELLEEAARRGALEELREALSIASVVTHAASEPCAADLAATARSLPTVSLLASVGHDIIPLPKRDGEVLTVRDAVSIARDVLRRLTTADAVAEQPAEAAESLQESRTVLDHPIDSAEPAFRRIGEMWEVEFAGRTALLRPSKGIDDLVRLLNQPGQEIHCLDLMGASVIASDTGTLIDNEARRQYEDRIRELQDDIDEAEADHDLVRAERATAELDTIVDHLTAALGAGGTQRRTGDSAERARSAVTQRIRGSIRRIGDALPPLSRHLEASIQTGIYCQYRPEHSVT